MLATIIIGLAIAGYCLWVIRKKWKDTKQGKFCSCGCADCPSRCHEFAEK